MAMSKKSVIGEFAILRKEIAFVAFGSNQGSAKLILEALEQEMASAGCPIVAKASLYTTEPWGDKDQEEYSNTVFAVPTAGLSGPLAMLHILQAIETKLGRHRDPKRKLGPRTIDLDLLYYGSQIVDSEELCLPHPRICARRFVLVPMDELAPDLMHPVLMKTSTALLAECYDEGRVEMVGKW